MATQDGCRDGSVQVFGLRVPPLAVGIGVAAIVALIAVLLGNS